MPCPRCSSLIVTKDGTTQRGGQRFRCTRCGRRCVSGSVRCSRQVEGGEASGLKIDAKLLFAGRWKSGPGKRPRGARRRGETLIVEAGLDVNENCRTN